MALAAPPSTGGALARRELSYRDRRHASNQEAALKRYGELLKDAKNVTEVLEVEHQIERLTAEIDRLKGDLAWTEDKVLRATVRVRIIRSEAAPEAVFAPKATLYPGVHGFARFDLRGPSQS